MSRLLRLAGLALAVGAASCGAPAPRAPTQAASVAEDPAPAGVPAVERGVVVGLRPVAPAPASEYRQRAMAQVMRVSSGAGTISSSPVEVVVRLERGGRDLAFLRGAEENFRLGQRVTLTAGDHPELLRGGGDSSGG